eukprot:gene34332-biopygen9109
MDHFRRTRQNVTITLPDGQDIAALVGSMEMAPDGLERRQVQDSVRKLVEGLPEEQREQLHTSLDTREAHVEAGSPDLYNYPFVHMTGHGRWTVSDAEAKNLRKYLESGGFLHIDDNYGMDPYVRPALKKIFPELELVELPFGHPLYHQKFNFNTGLPKVHEHDEKPPKGYGLIYKGRVVCFYSFETDLGDGWEDADVHHDAPDKRMAALQMGANLVQYVFTMNGTNTKEEKIQ